MKSLVELISIVDAVTLSFFSKEELEQRDNEFKNEDTSDPIARAEYEASDSIDIKATAVLQHASIMIAVTGFLLSQANTGFFKSLFACEIVLYIILALFCLRILLSQYRSARFSQTQNVTAKEAILDLTAKLTFLVSVILVVSVLAELVIK